jgi:hypothetical protein
VIAEANDSPEFRIAVDIVKVGDANVLYKIRLPAVTTDGRDTVLAAYHVTKRVEGITTEEAIDNIKNEVRETLSEYHGHYDAGDQANAIRALFGTPEAPILQDNLRDAENLFAIEEARVRGADPAIEQTYTKAQAKTINRISKTMNRIARKTYRKYNTLFGPDVAAKVKADDPVAFARRLASAAASLYPSGWMRRGLGTVRLTEDDINVCIEDALVNQGLVTFMGRLFDIDISRANRRSGRVLAAAALLASAGLKAADRKLKAGE